MPESRVNRIVNQSYRWFPVLFIDCFCIYIHSFGSILVIIVFNLIWPTTLIKLSRNKGFEYGKQSKKIKLSFQIEFLFSLKYSRENEGGFKGKQFLFT